MPIEPGVQARVVHVVAEGDTAEALRTGEVPVVSSSRLVAWCEEASLRALVDQDANGTTTVAMRVHLDHYRPVPVGAEVTSIATLERVEGRRFVFLVSALDAHREIVASGRVVRVAVDTDTFIASACGDSG